MGMAMRAAWTCHDHANLMFIHKTANIHSDVSYVDITHGILAFDTRLSSFYGKASK